MTKTDLSRFDGLMKAQEDGIDVDILGPDSKPLGFTIKVAGPDSARQISAQQEVIDERLRRRNAGPLTSEEIARSNLKVISASTMNWSPFVLDGKELACTAENAEALYTRFPFIREQVDAAAGNRADFLQKSA